MADIDITGKNEWISTIKSMDDEVKGMSEEVYGNIRTFQQFWVTHMKQYEMDEMKKYAFVKQFLTRIFEQSKLSFEQRKQETKTAINFFRNTIDSIENKTILSDQQIKHILQVRLNDYLGIPTKYLQVSLDPFRERRLISLDWSETDPVKRFLNRKIGQPVLVLMGFPGSGTTRYGKLLVNNLQNEPKENNVCWQPIFLDLTKELQRLEEQLEKTDKCTTVFILDKYNYDKLHTINIFEKPLLSGGHNTKFIILVDSTNIDEIQAGIFNKSDIV